MFDENKAQKAIDFVSALKHTKGRWAGKEFQLLGWQIEEVLKPLFGTVDENGYRLYRKCYVEVPKKNGKSELGAAVALYLLVSDGEFGAEIYSAACDRDQASIVFNVAAFMVEQEKSLCEILKVLRSTKRIVYPAKNSFYHVLSADAYTKHGYNIHGCIFDELHAQPNRELWDVLTEGTGTRFVMRFTNMQGRSRRGLLRIPIFYRYFMDCQMKKIGEMRRIGEK